MKNKVRKILILLFIICIIPIQTFADTPETSGTASIDDIFEDGDKFLENVKPYGQVLNTTALKQFSRDMYNYILAIGMVIAVIVGTYLGIKFMVSPLEEKAKVKETLTVYGVGCAVLFGGFTIWKVVVTVLESM